MGTLSGQPGLQPLSGPENLLRLAKHIEPERQNIGDFYQAYRQPSVGSGNDRVILKCFCSEEAQEATPLDLRGPVEAEKEKFYPVVMLKYGNVSPFVRLCQDLAAAGVKFSVRAQAHVPGVDYDALRNGINDLKSENILNLIGE